ncbi:hypothetical protein DAETH_03260 [Deinococcus aetherius]|uniref:Uncharacterized protein n=2 Tax=Deinococcus aetherius TaxID=200252 RepID=A0ABM8A9B1_9DEIO|nr:hypothetical protein DAETH_03260 [Deinococcus aetherius]
MSVQVPVCLIGVRITGRGEILLAMTGDPHPLEALRAQAAVTPPARVRAELEGQGPPTGPSSPPEAGEPGPRTRCGA